MKIKAIRITPAGLPELVEIGADLESAQAEVGGYVESIRLGHDALALVDEEAKLKAAPPPPNVLATNIARAAGIRPSDYIRGTMIIVGVLSPHGVHDGDFHDVPAWWVDMLGANPEPGKDES
jgi:hypothetical protein